MLNAENASVCINFIDVLPYDHMKLRFDGDKTYYQLTRNDADEFDAWLNAVTFAAKPDEVHPDDLYEYQMDKSNIRRIGNVSLQAYFNKLIKPEFMHLGFESETNENGISILRYPQNLQPGQYYTEYSIILDDHTDDAKSEWHDARYAITFTFDDSQLDYQDLCITRPIRRHLQANKQYSDEYFYQLCRDNNRLYAGHRCLLADISMGRYFHYPIVGDHATRDSFDQQVDTISRLLDIDRPGFLDKAE